MDVYSLLCIVCYVYTFHNLMYTLGSSTPVELLYFFCLYHRNHHPNSFVIPIPLCTMTSEITERQSCEMVVMPYRVMLSDFAIAIDIDAESQYFVWRSWLSDG